MSKISEPRTPSPYERLKLVEELMENGVPVVIRYQLFILGVSDSEESLTRLFSEFERVGVGHLIIESLRLPSNDLNFIRKLLIRKNI